jgi:hypothetical protein
MTVEERCIVPPSDQESPETRIDKLILKDASDLFQDELFDLSHIFE